MRRTLATLSMVGLLVALHVAGVHATSPSTCPSPTSTPAGSTASSPRVSTATTCSAALGPRQVLYNQLQARLDGDLARAVATQQQLSTALDQTTASELMVSDQVALEEQRISDLEDQIAQLDTQIQDTQDRIAVEREQVAAMARAVYRQPDSIFVLIARQGNLRDALVATADLVVAGQRAHALQARLQADLLKLQAQRAARQADLDRENGARDQLVASLNSLDNLMDRQSDLSSQLDDLMSQIQDAQSVLRDQAPDVIAAIATLLELQEADLVQKSNQAAWSRAQVGAGLALLTSELPTGKTLAGLRLSWPIAGAQITQPFGPSDLVLEPPLGPYPHFHTGLDLAAAPGTPVTAAADGVVVAAMNTQVGYGNYVIIAHGAGVMTLYGHLLEVDVKTGDRVTRGKRIGLEGSSGLSTGPHLHFELRVNNLVFDPMIYLPPLIGPVTPTI
ncbi:MAG TPA: peptidoglycan DD-metalloendopeptidase family protein [Candidatus Dormibacteraeota bacterium]|nr:peptidoglycan DD-metalloendopeptidase family protein [Candidatus Dormibacteraeota bacterium]